MAFDLKASVKLADEFTSPMRKILRMFDQLDSTMRTTDRAWGDIGNSAQQAANQVNNFGQQTQGSSQHITELQRQLDLARLEAQRLADAGGGAGGNLDDLGNSGANAGNKISGAFKKAAGIVASVVAIDKIKDLTVSMVESAGAAKAMSAQFSEVFGDLEGEAAKRLNAIGEEATILDSRMKGSFTKIAAFAKTGGMDTAQSLDLADRSMRAVADSAAFYDRSLEDTTESLQSFLKGNFENDAALGLSATETTRNIAANREFGKSFKDLSESQKQLTLLSMVEEANKVGGAMGQAARESDGLENVIGNLKQSWIDLKAAVGVPIMDVAVEQMVKLTEFMGKVDGQKIADSFISAGAYLSDTFGPILGNVRTDLEKLWSVIKTSGGGEALKTSLDGFKEGMLWISKNYEDVKTGIMAVTAAIISFNTAMAASAVIGPITHLVRLYRTGMLLTATQLKITAAAQWMLNAAMSANPIGLVATAIAGLVAAGVVLYRNWDAVSAKAKEMWGIIKTFGDGIKGLFYDDGQKGRDLLSSIGISEDLISKLDAIAANISAFKNNVGDTWKGFKALFTDDGQEGRDILTSLGFTEGVVGRLDSFASKFSDIKNKIIGFFVGIKNDFLAEVQSIKDGWNNFTQAIVDGASYIKNSAIQNFVALRDGIKNTFLAIINFYKQLPERAAFAIGYAAGYLVEFFSTLPGRIGTFISQSYTTAVTKLTELKNAFIFYGSAAVLGAVFWISQLPGRIQGFLIQTATQAQGKLIELATSFTVWFGQSYLNAVNWLSQLPGAIASFLVDAYTRSVGVLQSIASKFKEWFGSASKNATDEVKKVPENVASSLSEVPGKTKGAIKEIWESFKALGAAIPEAIAAGFESAKASLGKAANWAIDKAIGGLDRVKSIGSGIANAFKGGFASGRQDVDGSHATGLARVGKNGYVAELHKDESVLTAGQSNTLRGLGVLKSKGNKPILDGSALAGSRTGTGQTVTRSPNSAPVSISGLVVNINGVNKTTKEMAREFVDELSVVISNGALAGVN